MTPYLTHILAIFFASALISLLTPPTVSALHLPPSLHPRDDNAYISFCEPDFWDIDKQLSSLPATWAWLLTSLNQNGTFGFEVVSADCLASLANSTATPSNTNTTFNSGIMKDITAKASVDDMQIITADFSYGEDQYPNGGKYFSYCNAGGGCVAVFAF